MRMSFLKTILIFVMITSIVGCTCMNGMEQRVLSGSAIGTATGVGAAAVIGGPLVIGAVVGAAAGAVGGLFVNEVEKTKL
jgi:hypothetical protein